MLKGLRRLNKTASGGSGFLGIFDDAFAPTRVILQQEQLKPRPSRLSPDPEPPDGAARFAGRIRITVPGD